MAKSIQIIESMSRHKFSIKVDDFEIKDIVSYSLKSKAGEASTVTIEIAIMDDFKAQFLEDKKQKPPTGWQR